MPWCPDCQSVIVQEACRCGDRPTVHTDGWTGIVVDGTVTSIIDEPYERGDRGTKRAR